MLDSKFREQGPPEKFDNTMIANYVDCPMKFYWFMRRLAPVTTPAYFTFGRAFGQGINKWHETQEGSGDNELRLLAAKKVAHDIWVAEHPTEKGNDNYANLMLVLEEYTDKYSQPEAWTTVATEIGFVQPIPGTTVSYAGSLDSYIEWPGYGKLLREDKTTGGWLDASYLRQWDHASQVTGYYWALWREIGEEPFGCLMNLASKRPRKDPDEKFSRVLQKRSDWKINQFMGETVRIIDQIRNEWDVWEWARLGERNPINCGGGMGRTPCDYRAICRQDAQPWDIEKNIKPNFAGMGFKELPPWQPWEREGTDD